MKFMRELEENNMARAEGRKEGRREGHEVGVADVYKRQGYCRG